MIQRYWLIFTQALTVALAVLFVVTTLKPEWIGQPRATMISLREAAPLAPAVAASTGYRNGAQKALPSVVHVFTSKAMQSARHPLLEDPIFRHFFGDRLELDAQRTSSLGSGVIISTAGYILTNYHVVEAADDIEIALSDGRNFRARVVGSDPESDIAVLQLTADAGKIGFGPELPAVTFAPPDSAQVGDVVLAIGNPFGVGQTVTMGIVSALGRSHLGINTFENFIQTDAAINPGNSGGALIDTEGNLLGINTAIYSQSGGSLGIGFAIPAASARSIMEQIVQHGSVTRGWIGVEAQEINAELAESFGLPDTRGALIAGVLRGSPADKAGIRPGDILLSVGDKPISDPQNMLDTIAALKPDDSVRFNLRRNNQTSERLVKIGKRPPITRDE